MREADSTSAVSFRQEVFSASCFFRLTSVRLAAFAIFLSVVGARILVSRFRFVKRFFSPLDSLWRPFAFATGFLRGGGLCILRFVSSRRIYFLDTVRFRSFGRHRLGGATCVQTRPWSTPFFRAAAKDLEGPKFAGFRARRGRSGSTPGPAGSGSATHPLRSRFRKKRPQRFVRWWKEGGKNTV